jgi:hypothetical protein
LSRDNFQSYYFPKGIIMTHVSDSLQVGPNAVLRNDALYVDGRPQVLRHAKDLKTIVLLTQSAVCALLEALFPHTKGVPAPDGRTTPSEVAGWRDYARHTLAFQTAAPGSPEEQEHGNVLLQWCAAAVIVAKVSNHPVRTERAYIAVSFLARHGGEVLGRTEADWERWLAWRAEEAKPTALAARLDGRSQKDPRPPAQRVEVPWPEELGVDLGGPQRLLANALGIASDILFEDDTSWLVVGPNRVRIDIGDRLVAQFEAETTRPNDNFVEQGISCLIGPDRYHLRASRQRGHAGRSQYCFRVLPTDRAPADLSALGFAEPPPAANLVAG